MTTNKDIIREITTLNATVRNLETQNELLKEEMKDVTLH